MQIFNAINKMRVWQWTSLTFLALASQPSSAFDLGQTLVNALKQGLQQQMAGKNPPADGSSTSNAGSPAQTAVPAAAPEQMEQASVNEQAAPLNTDPAKQDLTAFFKPLENGCLPSDELGAFYNGLREGKMVLPADLVGPKSKPVVVKNRGLVETTTPLRGLYYGVPVTKVQRYSGIENGMNGVSIYFSVSLASAKAKLSRVRYKKDSEMDFQASLIKDGANSVLVCDTST